MWCEHELKLWIDISIQCHMIDWYDNRVNEQVYRSSKYSGWCIIIIITIAAYNSVCECKSNSALYHPYSFLYRTEPLLLLWSYSRLLLRVFITVSMSISQVEQSLNKRLHSVPDSLCAIDTCTSDSLYPFLLFLSFFFWHSPSHSLKRSESIKAPSLCKSRHARLLWTSSTKHRGSVYIHSLAWIKLRRSL